jgi:hypothetical protein
MFSIELNSYLRLLLLCVTHSVVSCVVMNGYECSICLVLFCIWWMGSVCCYLVFNLCNDSNIGLNISVCVSFMRSL